MGIRRKNKLRMLLNEASEYEFFSCEENWLYWLAGSWREKEVFLKGHLANLQARIHLKMTTKMSLTTLQNYSGQSESPYNERGP